MLGCCERKHVKILGGCWVQFAAATVIVSRAYEHVYSAVAPGVDPTQLGFAIFFHFKVIAGAWLSSSHSMLYVLTDSSPLGMIVKSPYHIVSELNLNHVYRMTLKSEQLNSLQEKRASFCKIPPVPNVCASSKGGS